MSHQYPHYLFKLVPGASVKGDDGGWTKVPDSWVLHSECREETNGKGSQINTADGKAVLFSSTVYLPAGTSRIPEGTEVLVNEASDRSGLTRVQGRVLKCDLHQLNGRLWV